MRVTTLFFTVVALSSVSTLAHSYYFEDGFESGDLSATNAQGFEWGRPNGTYVFTSEGAVWGPPGYFNPPITTSPLAGYWSENADSNWQPANGSHFLNYIYAPTKNWTEQRFDLGASVPDIWIRYWLRVPESFNMTPGCDSSSTGNKFLALWHDGYSSGGEGATVIMGYKPANSGAGPDGDFSYNWSVGCNTNLGKKNNLPAQCSNGNKPDNVTWRIIRSPEDQGRWMQVVLHARSSSASGVADGLIEVYHRWEDETEFRKFSSPGIYLHKVGGGFQAGYLMGDAGIGHCTQTEWLMDDFTVSDQPLLSTDAVKMAPPMPPSGVK